MKYLTSNNYDKAVALIEEKGYSYSESCTIALNCFAVAQEWDSTVEDCINRLERKER